MQQIIPYLVAALILVLIAVLVKVFFILNEVKHIANDAQQTIQRLNGIAEKTEKIITEELTPTLQVARQTLTNVEATTRVLAETTQSAQNVVKRVEGFLETGKLVATGVAVAKAAAQKTAGLFSLFGRKSKPKTAPPKRIAEKTPAKRRAEKPEG